MLNKLFYLILFTLLIGIIISFPLWINDRILPPISVFDVIVTTGWVHWILLSLWGILFILLILGRLDKRKVLLAFIVLSVIFALQDQLRWQPWFYHIEIMLVFYLLYYQKLIEESELVDIFRILLIGIYAWSGLHKFNAVFIEETLMEIFLVDIGVLGYAIPLIEVFLALSLIFKQTRNYSVIGLTVMHLLILFSFFTGGMSHNLVIMPWNIMMIIMVYSLFWSRDGFEVITFRFFNSIWRLSAVILFMIFPASNIIGIWDSYPSFTLYSGKTDKGYLYVSENFKENFSEASIEHFNDENKIYLQQLFFTEFAVPIYPEKRIYKNLFRNMCIQSLHELDVILQIEYLPNLFKNEWNKESFFCDEFIIEEHSETDPAAVQ